MKLVCLGWCVCTFVFASSDRSIYDNADLFDSQTLRLLQRGINEINETYEFRLIIETFSSPHKKEYAEKSSLEGGLAADQIQLVIIKEPLHAFFAIGNGLTKHMELTQEKTDKVLRVLATRFKEQQYNAGILDTLHAFRATLSNIKFKTAIPILYEIPPPFEYMEEPIGLALLKWFLISLMLMIWIRYLSVYQKPRAKYGS